MAVFVDSSAFFAGLDADDKDHESAIRVWNELAGREELLVVSNYVVLETISLSSRRLGLQAVRDFQSRYVPLVQVYWVDQDLHEQAMATLLTAGRRHLSLVDCVSFELMRRRGLESVFTFDSHFADQGFHCLH